MPKTAARRRPVAISAALVGVSVAVLLVNPVSAPLAGAAVAPGSTLRASVANDGTHSPSGGIDNAISADGTAVAFTSRSVLDPSLSTGEYRAVFVRDLARNRTVMISRGLFFPPDVPKLAPEPLLDLGAPLPARARQQQPSEVPPNGDSLEPSLSADGRYVAFRTAATNIVPGASPNRYVVVCDRNPDGDADFDEDVDLGDGQIRRDYRCFSVNDVYNGARLSEPRIAANASRIVWREWYSGDGYDSSIMTAALTLDDGELVPGPAEPVPADLGPNMRTRYQFDPDISGDGNHIVMSAEISVACDGCQAPNFRAILSYDVRDKSTTRADFDNGDPVSKDLSVVVMHPAISFDGTVIAFQAEEFVDTCSPYECWNSKFNQPNVYVVRVDYAEPPGERVIETTIASRNNAGDLVNGARPALSADGRYLAFVTDAVDTHDGEDRPTTEFTCINPEPEGVELKRSGPLDFSAAIPPQRPDVRTACQVVVRDLIVDQARLRAELRRLPGTLASPGRQRDCVRTLPLDASCAGVDDSFSPSLSGTGGRIAFDSFASDLVENDINEDPDVFVRTLEPTLRAVPNPLSFGEVEVGQVPPTRSVRLDEVGAGPLFVEAVDLAGTNAADFEIVGTDCQGRTLHQTESCLVTVAFGPEASGARQGQLRIRVRGGRALTVDLRGTGTEQPPPVPRGAVFSVGPSPLDFGERLVQSSGPELTTTVTNTGGSPMQINSVAPVGPGAPGDYTVTANTCLGSVPAGGQCRVSVRFTPAEPGERTAALQFNDTAGGPHLVGLRGTAPPLSIEVNPGVTPPGRVTTVTGKGFPPGKSVTVTFEQRPGQTTATVGQDGTFRAQLLVFPKTAPENRTVVATVDGSPALLAKTTLLIVFPSVNPADFVVRG